MQCENVCICGMNPFGENICIFSKGLWQDTSQLKVKVWQQRQTILLVNIYYPCNNFGDVSVDWVCESISVC